MRIFYEPRISDREVKPSRFVRKVVSFFVILGGELVFFYLSLSVKKEDNVSRLTVFLVVLVISLLVLAIGGSFSLVSEAISYVYPFEVSRIFREVLTVQETLPVLDSGG